MTSGIGVAPIVTGATKINPSKMRAMIKNLEEKRMEEKGKKAKGAPPTDMVSLSMEGKEAGKKGKAKAEATPHEKGPKGVKGHHEKGPKGVNGHRKRITDAYELIKKQAAENKREAPKADLASNVSANISLNGTATGKVEEKTPAATETYTPKAALPENDILKSLNNFDNSLNQLLSGNNGLGAGSLFNNLDNLASSLGALGNIF